MCVRVRVVGDVCTGTGDDLIQTFSASVFANFLNFFGKNVVPAPLHFLHVASVRQKSLLHADWYTPRPSTSALWCSVSNFRCSMEQHRQRIASSTRFNPARCPNLLSLRRPNMEQLMASWPRSWTLMCGPQSKILYKLIDWSARPPIARTKNWGTMVRTRVFVCLTTDFKNPAISKTLQKRSLRVRRIFPSKFLFSRFSCN